MYVLVSCLGGLLNIDLTIEYFRPTVTLFGVPWITPSVFTPPNSYGFFFFFFQNELIGTTADDELFRGTLCGLIEVKQNEPTTLFVTFPLFTPALQLKIEKRA